jgi:putative membrane protein
MRPTSLAVGLLTLGCVWIMPLHVVVPGGFSAHMTMHMGVVAVAAPLLAYGVAGGRFDPVLRAPVLFSPIPASVVELLVVWAWHTPALHHAARHSSLAFVVEQGTFLASGLLVWLSAFGGAAADRERRGAAGVVALLLTSMHMTLLGALLALPPRPLYAHPFPGQGALGPLQDQHLGGAIMLVVGGVSYLAGGLWLSGQLLTAGRTEKARVRSSVTPVSGASRGGNP